MNKSDLAALAALGIGGYYLYNRNKGDAAPKGADMPAVPAAKEVVMPYEMPATASEMPTYQGRSADRREDIQREYGQDYQTPYNAPKASVAKAAPAAKAAPMVTTPADARTGARGAQGYGEDDSSSMAAKAALAQGDAAKVNSLGATKAYMDNQRAKAATQSTAAKATLAQGDAAKVGSLRAAADYRKQAAAKKAANTAKSQEIVDRMRTRTKPYMKDEAGNDMKRGGAVKKMASGGSVSSASSRGDGIAQRGKTRGKMC